MADWQIVLLVVIGIFVLSMRNRRSDPPEQQQHRESWGARLNRKAADHTDYTDPYATQLRNERNPQYLPEINGKAVGNPNDNHW